jgi:hypothetical protein
VVMPSLKERDGWLFARVLSGFTRCVKPGPPRLESFGLPLGHLNTFPQGHNQHRASVRECAGCPWDDGLVRWVQGCFG